MRPVGILVILVSFGASSAHAKQPNILWITAEDMSPTLGCYGDEQAHSPNIDRLAEKSVRYTHAFATAPVCSPSRSCLITGCYAQSLGTHQMRSAFPIPEYMTGFPSYLRKAGYYTTNNVKTDYNTANWKKIIHASWDESSPTAHWRNRPKKDQPFFAVFNLMTSHQSRSMVWPYEKFQSEVQGRLASEEITGPKSVRLPPYYPDTPVVRKTVARFYDCVAAMDKEVGDILAQLKEDGLEEETIVFFYSDHGSGMPRHKRALLDSGMHIPLLIHTPKKFQDQVKWDGAVDRLVSFVDFGPTVLSIAGVEIPDYMQGEPFLGKAQSKPRQFVYGHRDRVDEVIDCARSIRSKRYLYIRNYMPHLGYNQRTAWPDLGEIRHEFYKLNDISKATPAQWQFVSPTRPVEELYDCQADPLNLTNLAGKKEYADRLAELRKAHQQQIREIKDIGFIPEIEEWKLAEKTTPYDAVRNESFPWEEIYRAADVSVGFASDQRLIDNLKSENPVVRYWAAVGFASLPLLTPKGASALVDTLRQKDESPAVAIAAADALARQGAPDDVLAVLVDHLQAEDMTTVMVAARTLELIGLHSPKVDSAMKKALAKTESMRDLDAPPTVVQVGDADLAMFAGFAINAFLNQKVEHELGWETLFNSKDLSGWKALAKGDVEVKDGEIHILSKGANLWLLHEKSFKDFELTAEAKMPDDAYNSGIGFRCIGAGAKPKGYQCEIDRAKSGMIYAIGSGWVWPKGDRETKRFNEMSKDAFDNAKWNHFRIRCQGDSIKIWVNEVLTADIKDERHEAGSVALQHHGKGGLHRFRNIQIRELE